MKRKIVFIILCVLFMLEIFYLQVSREPTVNNVITSSNKQGYDADLTITANKIFIINQDKLEEQLIQQILDNDFKNVQMSYDLLGYPNKITITVYTNDLTKYLGIPAFHITYENNSLKNHPHG